MRVANVSGRAAIVRGRHVHDLERASEGRFRSAPEDMFEHWSSLKEWADSHTFEDALGQDFDSLLRRGVVGPPSPRPRQVFGIGLNYRAHAAEAGLTIPDAPVTFTKFPSCLDGPYGELVLPSETVDWEVELVVVMSGGEADLPTATAWDYVAGVSVGQDISDRVVQARPPIPQFSLGKSFPSFGPFGPTVVSTDELADRDSLDLCCSVNGEEVQRSNTSDLIFSVPEIIAFLSSIVTLYAGDVIFTGTPSGVGGSRSPKWFLRPGDLLESEVVGIGKMQQRCVVRATQPNADRAEAVGRK